MEDKKKKKLKKGENPVEEVPSGWKFNTTSSRKGGGDEPTDDVAYEIR